jgi:hypothetical protein
MIKKACCCPHAVHTAGLDFDIYSTFAIWHRFLNGFSRVRLPTHIANSLLINNTNTVSIAA